MKVLILAGGLGSRLSEETTLKPIVDWKKAYLKGENIREITINQIEQYFE